MKHYHVPLCEPDASSAPLANYRAILKENTKNPGSKPAKAIQDTNAVTDRKILTVVGSKDSLRLIVKRVKKKINPVPQQPKTLQEFVIVSPLDKTISGCKFLLLQRTLDSSTCYALFTTESSLDLLASSPFWIMDGTFKTVPHLFGQVYTIHGYV